MSIPLNEEHVDARQADIDAQRQEIKSKMTPTERARLEVIEECAAKLEAAQVPFQLWAASEDGKSDDDGSRKFWICFHKLSYVPKADMVVYNDRVFEAWQSLLPYILTHQTCHGEVTIVTHSLKTGRAVAIHSRGECQFIPPPPDLSTCDCPPPSS